MQEIGPANFNNLLLILKHLGSGEFLNKIRVLNPSVEYDVRLSVEYALQNGSSDYYTSLYATHVNSTEQESNENEGNDQSWILIDMGKHFCQLWLCF